jgi:hypothetical protein
MLLLCPVGKTTVVALSQRESEFDRHQMAAVRCAAQCYWGLPPHKMFTLSLVYSGFRSVHACWLLQVCVARVLPVTGVG